MRCRDDLRGKGVSPDRLEFVAKQPWPNIVRTHGRIDIALDPFPYGGGITTCDALWMGVPVVSLVGRTAVGRGGASILANIGMPELIALHRRINTCRSPSGLAKDLPRLAESAANAASADAGVAADGCAAICPQYRSGVSADVAELVRGMTNRAVAHIKSGVSPAVLEKLLRDLPRNGTRIKDRGYRQVWRFEFEGKGYYLKFYPRRGMRLKRIFRGSAGDARVRPPAGDAARGVPARGQLRSFRGFGLMMRLGTR